MSANDYYHAQPANPYTRPQYLPDRPNQQLSAPDRYNPSYSVSSLDQSSSHLPSAADSRPHHYDRNDSNPHVPYNAPIPLKHKQSLNTSQDDWPSHANQYPQYPPSPESQIPAPSLIQPQKSSKKKKNGFFSGKIPWVVYIVSLVQITVFIVEIIKNCKSTSPLIVSHR